MRRFCLALLGAITLVPKESAAQAGTPPAQPAAPAPPSPAPPAQAPQPQSPAPQTPPAQTQPSPAPAPAPPTPPAPGAQETPPSAQPPAAPPEYYVEPQKRAGSGPSAAPAESEIYEPPPPPTAEPGPPPLAPNYVAPKTALWMGLRLAYFVPFGTLWFDGNYDGQGGLLYRRRSFSGYASPGPAAEVDVGARLGRRYNLFAMWEHASLGPGNLDADSFGGQQRGSTNLYGVGFRFSTQPDSVGLLVEVGFGYRTFTAYWTDGTELSMNDTFFEGRIGLGVDIRVSKWLSLSPMVVFSQGSFTSAQFSGPTARYSGFTAYDQQGQYDTFSLQLGAHADVF